MSRDFYVKSLTFILGILALVAIGACTVASAPGPAPDYVEHEPTVIPTPTKVPATPTPTVPQPTATPDEPVATPEPTPALEPDATATPEPTPEPPAQDDESDIAEAEEDTAEQASEDDDWPGRPVHLWIERIGVEAAFEWVSITPEGNMDAPQGWDNVGWYEPGTVPGEPGNAVIAGHLDRPGGSPAVFYKLRELAPGDQIVLQTEHNHILVFEVTEIEVVDALDAPLEKIFGASDERNLNLITCEGVWDRNSAMYDKRLVVYSTLVDG